MTSRACVFIDSNDPRARNKLINTVSCNIKPPFPPNINLEELVAKTLDDSRSARSPNAFIIYRKAFVHTARKDGYQLPMTVVSSMASNSWDSEPEFVKAEYKKLAKEANTIRNNKLILIPKHKKRRQQWNIVSFPAPTDSTTETTTSSSSPVNNKSIIKKKKEETKEISTPTNSIPPITFNIPYDICSKIEDRYKESTIDNPSFTTNSNSLHQQQEEFNFNHFDNNKFNYPQIDTQESIDIHNVAGDINNEFDFDFGFINEHGVFCPFFWD